MTAHLDAEVDHVGFSGSRLGMSNKQLEWVERLLRLRMTQYGLGWFHHGGCIGADYEAHKIARNLGYKIDLHPPLDNKFQVPGLGSECDKVDDAYSYHGRNQRIVLASKFLMMTPNSTGQRGGTWNTIQHAAASKRTHTIIFRNGEIKEYSYVS